MQPTTTKTTTQNSNTNSSINNLYGIMFMLINAVVISIIYTVVKQLSHYMSSSQVVFLYKFSVLLLITPWVFQHGISGLRTKKLHLHLSRGIFSISGSLFFMYAIKHVNMASATALDYLVQVIMVIIGILYFKEKASKTKFWIVFLSFLGALIVVSPDLISFEKGQNLPDFFIGETNFLENSNFYYIFVFCAIACWAANCTVVKMLGKTESSKAQTFYVMLFSSIFSYPIAFIHWMPTKVLGFQAFWPEGIISFWELEFNLWIVMMLGLLALCYFIHSLAFFHAFKHGELSTVMPFDYSRIVFTGLLGYYFFNEIPSFYSYFGYLLIVAPGVYFIKIEMRKRKKAKQLKLEQQQINELEAEFENA